MILFSRELLHQDSKEYIENFLLRCRDLLQDKVVVYHCVSLVWRTGNEVMYAMLGLRSSILIPASSHEDSCKELTDLFASSEEGFDGYMHVAPINNIAQWDANKSKLDEMIVNDIIPGHLYIASNLTTYRPPLKLSPSRYSPSYISALTSNEKIEGFKLVYKKSVLGDVLYHILSKPYTILQFSMMMSNRESYVYVVLVLESPLPAEESFSVKGDLPEMEPVKTLKHYHNIARHHRECGIPIFKGSSNTGKSFDMSTKPEKLDSFYKSLEKTCNKTLYATLTIDNSIKIEIVKRA